METKILSKEAFDHVKSLGVEFATLQDAGECLLRIVADKSVNGHTLFLSPRKWATKGYVDLGLEDYRDKVLQEITTEQLKGSESEEKLFVSGDHSCSLSLFWPSSRLILIRNNLHTAFQHHLLHVLWLQ